MITKTMSVSAIQSGTVIDHIPAGVGLYIVNLLQWTQSQCRMTLGLRLPSSSMGNKDIIKIENKVISDDEVSYVSIYAPKATVSLIEDYKILRKYSVSLPPLIRGTYLMCANPKCITRSEEMASCFTILQLQQIVKLNCRYCEQSLSYPFKGLS